MKDLKVNHKWDLVLNDSLKQGYEIDRTKYNFEEIMQAINTCLMSKVGDWKLDSFFGASPVAFLGSPMRASLFSQMESFIRESIIRSKVLPLNALFNVKSAPIDFDKVALRVEVYDSNGAAAIKLNYIYSTSDNNLYPLANSYGA
jgi:hypothetical protein